MEEKLVTIAEFPSYIEAELARQILSDFGIEAVVTGENTSNVYSMPTIGAAGLQVFESKAQEAKEILDSQEHDNDDDEEFDEDLDDLDDEDFEDDEFDHDDDYDDDYDGDFGDDEEDDY